MPWRGPEVPGEFPTLGYQVADWIEDMCAIPDGWMPDRRQGLGQPVDGERGDGHAASQRLF